MNKTITILLGIIIVFLILLSIFEGNNFSEIKSKVTSVENNVASASDSIKETIKNINKVKDAITSAQETIDRINIDLNKMDNKLKQEFINIKSGLKELEEKKKSLDMEIAKLKDKIPGDSKELKEPKYQKLGDAK